MRRVDRFTVACLAVGLFLVYRAWQQYPAASPELLASLSACEREMASVKLSDGTPVTVGEVEMAGRACQQRAEERRIVSSQAKALQVSAPAAAASAN